MLPHALSLLEEESPFPAAAPSPPSEKASSLLRILLERTPPGAVAAEDLERAEVERMVATAVRIVTFQVRGSS